MLYQVLLVVWNVYTWPPPSDSTVLLDGHDKSTPILKKGPQMTGAFAASFFSTFFNTAQRAVLLDSDEKCQTILPHCRGPPLLKSGFLKFQKIRRSASWQKST